ncbi:PREDICTED: NACHT, LRR and PYD domains-containing protein 13 [Galeopterus variegatus]|uniref:NACHT, LRR and PYD domains-containing protein 13 n=1 Tax=Galeopterus variegatus TaxID=482537 RepID=A0ABM0RBV2_GALVR|nr:PREDICTED: NACHT, LRR and PYD domains-containing protein 13 [Galeopterus variegatus]
MSSSATASVHNCTNDQLLSYLEALDEYQLEEFKLCLQSQQLLLANFRPIPWANLKAADPLNLFFLLNEHFSEWQAWEVALSIFKNMNLTSLCEKVKAEMRVNMQTQGIQVPNQEELEFPEEETGHRKKYRERMRAKILAIWDNIPWPEDHIYLRNTTEQEHEELKNILDPNGTGAQAQTIVLEGRAGVGKTTLAMKAMLHWADGLLFQHRFSYVFYLSCHKMKDMEEVTFADLLSCDWPDFQAPIEEFMSQPERLLFIVDGFEEMTMPELHPYNLDDNLPCADWYQKLPVTKILLSLLKKELVPLATLVITTRTFNLKDLQNLLVNPCFVEITGFEGDNQEEYFVRHFGDPKKAKKILRQIRKNETVFNSFCAPMLCWAVCSCLKQQKARHCDLQPITQTTTSLYAYFFSTLFSTAEVRLAEQSWPGQWRVLCALAAEGMWSMTFSFRKEDTRYRCLEARFIDSLFRFNILRKVSDCEDCITFTHSSFQEFFAAMFYVLEETEGSLDGSTKLKEMKILLSAVFVDRNFYWTPLVLFFFGLLKKDLARELENTLHCKLSPRIMEELLEWGEELDKPETVSMQFDVLQFFRCLHETQEEDFVRKMLGHIFEADLDILGNIELRVSSFCLMHCQRLNKLRLSVSSTILQRELTSDVETLELWFCQLGALSCKHLSDALLQNKGLTHLNLSKNHLGDEGVKFLCEALCRPDCSLQNLDLSDCSFTTVGCQELAKALEHNHNVQILDIGRNDLQDDGIKQLCEALKHPSCVLNTLGLEKCNLTPACCQHLSSVLSSSKNLVNLNLIGNDLTPDGAKTLCKALRKLTCKLRKLG